MKRSALFKTSLISVFILLSLFIFSNAANAETVGLSEDLNSRLNGSISLFISSNKAYVNNELKKIDPNDDAVVPLIKNNRTLLPVRFIVENFGATVNWDDSTSTVEINFGDRTAKLKLGDNRMTVNGTEFLLDAKAESINSRTFIPLRSLAENLLGKKVFYYNGLIVISDKENILDESKETDLINEISDLIGLPLFLVRQNDKFGYIDRNGKIVIKPKYDYAGFFSEGLASVNIDGEQGYINRFGELVISNSFIRGNNFKEGLAAVEITEDDDTLKWGFINKKGEYVIVPQFESVGDFCDGMAVFEKDDKCGCIDKDGKVVVEPEYDYLDDFSEGFASVSINDKYGFIDKKGNITIDPIYEYTGGFHEGLAQACIDGKYGYIDVTGKFVIEPEFEFTADFSEGLACVELNGKFGFINKKGEFAIQPGFEFEEFWSTFEDGMAIIQDTKGENFKYGFIDKTGKVVIQPAFETTWGFDNGLAIVMENEGFARDGKIGYIDKSGKFVWALQK